MKTKRLLSLMSALTLVSIPVAVAQAMAPRTVSVGSERAAVGQTAAEQSAEKRRLHETIKRLVPADIGQSAVSVGLDSRDKLALAERTTMGFAPLRVGIVKSLPGLVGKPFGKAFSAGITQRSRDGGFVWALEVRSPGARAIRLHFEGFSLPEDTQMFFLGGDGQAHGPYTGAGRNGNGDFWTRSVAASHGTIVLYYRGSTPEAHRPEMAFRVTQLAHIRGRGPSNPGSDDASGATAKSHDTWPCADNAPCLVDVNCVNTGPAAPAEAAVAKMEWIDGLYVNTCTGGLLADTDPTTQIPYFLTANHCLTQDSTNLETFFGYTTSTCNGDCPDSIASGGAPPPASTIGATVVATGSAADFTLLKLSEPPPAGATFLGWNNSPVHDVAGAGLYRISNANFGPQVYSQHDVDPTSPECTGWPRGPRIYSVDRVGSTMGGSSGSPVLNDRGEVVGQLSGCCGYNCTDSCDPANNWTVDGALAYYWDQVASFLDPQPGCTADGECDDGQFCTGPETCNAGVCESAGNPCVDGATCNEATDACQLPACDDDGTCEAGENCTNCPNDCRQKTNGNPNSRFCCDGDLPECGDSRCGERGWSCGNGAPTCTTDGECADGQYCNGVESCSGGACQPGADPCPGQSCDEVADRCVTCAGHNASCSSGSDCCSGNCRRGRCKGN